MLFCLVAFVAIFARLGRQHEERIRPISIRWIQGDEAMTGSVLGTTRQARFSTKQTPIETGLSVQFFLLEKLLDLSPQLGRCHIVGDVAEKAVGDGSGFLGADDGQGVGLLGDTDG